MGKRGTEYARTERDLYPTPNRVIAALAEHVDLNRLLVWEPAAGNGGMVEALRCAGCAKVYASDIVDYGNGQDKVLDFLSVLGTLQRDTRRYQFSNTFEVIDLGLRLADIAGLEREPATATRTSPNILRAQLAENRAAEQEIAILLSERVELNAMTSDALIEMIERKLKAYGLKKVIPDGDLLGKAYRASHHSKQLREKFEQIEDEFEAPEIEIPRNLKEQVSAVLDEHGDLRWDDAIQIVLDKSQLDRVRAEKQKAKGSSKRKSSPSLHDGRTR